MWLAVCECSWRGKRRRLRADADHDKLVHEHVHKVVDAAPPLSAEQVRNIRALFGYRVW